MPYRAERISGRCRSAGHPAPPSKQPPGQGAPYVSEGNVKIHNRQDGNNQKLWRVTMEYSKEDLMEAKKQIWGVGENMGTEESKKIWEENAQFWDNAMGDRIVVMKDGYIQQIDSPINLYENPVNKFVAGFMGSPQMNFINAKLIMLNGKYTVEFGSEDTKTTRGRKFYVELPGAKTDTEALKYYVDKEVILGIRPENIHDEEMFLSNAKTGMIEATVDVTEMMGAESYLYLTCEGIPLTARVSPRCTARPQDVIKLALDPNKVHLFDPNDEHSILV